MLRRPAFVSVKNCLGKNILSFKVCAHHHHQSTLIIINGMMKTSSRSLFATSAEDLFGEMEGNPISSSTISTTTAATNNVPQDQQHQQQEHSLLSSLSEQQLENFKRITTLISQLLADKVETLSRISADRRERGEVDEKLEKQFGSGSSKEWIQKNKEIKNNTSNENNNNLSTESSPSSCSSLYESTLNLLSTPRSFSDSLVKLQQALDELKKQNNNNNNNNNNEIQQEQTEYDLLFACAMKSSLSHARSPTEARAVLEMVKLYSAEISNNFTNENKNSSSSPLVWMAAVEAGALSLATPEFFARLLDEALNQVDRTLLENFSKNKKNNNRQITVIKPFISSFYTSALSWAASQYDIETSLKIWSHCLSRSEKYGIQILSQEDLLRNAALVIRSTNELVAANSSSSTTIGEFGNAAGGPDSLNMFGSSSSLINSSSIGASASKFDGGVRNAMFKKLFSNRRDKNSNNNLAEILTTNLSWQNFEAILSCFDNETQVKLMKIKMIRRQENKSEPDGDRQDETNLRHLFELLKRFVSSADVSSAEDVSKIILSSPAAKTTSSNLIKSETITLMLRLYCDILSPTDFDSALDLFTKYCRRNSSSSTSHEEQNSFSCRPTSQHYSILLRGVDSTDDASSLFLDACSAGVVLDASSYRNLFQRESNTTLERLRQQLPEPSPEVMARLDASGVVPPLPLEADAHALRLQELEGEFSSSPIPLA